MKRIITTITAVVTLAVGAVPAQASYRHELHQLRAQQAGAIYGLFDVTATREQLGCPTHGGPSQCQVLNGVYHALWMRSYHLGQRIVTLEAKH